MNPRITLSEEILDFSADPSLSADEHAGAVRQFYHILQHFESIEQNQRHSRSPTGGQRYSQTLLVRYTYEYACTQQSRHVFLRAFFRSMQLSLEDEEELDFKVGQVEADIGSALFNFAEHLLDNFYLLRR